MTKIYYDDIDLFSGIGPTPFVGRDISIISYNDRWGEKETLKLDGVITGDCSGFSGLISRQNALFSGLSKDFKTFQIKDDALVVFSRPLVQVKSISFPSSEYAYTLPYSIELECYPSGYFSGSYGVLDPKNDFSYTETRDGILNLSRTTSAKGFNTSSSNNNALSNAKTWVNSKVGLGSLVLPAFIAGYSSQTFCLVTSAETINRFTGSYEIKETYTTDLSLIGFGILRYTVEYDKDLESGKSVVRVQGDIQGCKNGTIEQLRARYASFSAFNEAKKLYYLITGETNLNPYFLSKGLSEDPQRNKLSFSFVFDDRLGPRTRFEYSVHFDYDLENDIISAEIDGTVSSEEPIESRWAIVKAFAANINLFSLLLAVYNPYIAGLGISFPLNPSALSFSKTENEFLYEIRLSAKYSNERISPHGFSELSTSIDVTPSLEQYSFSPCLDGQGQYIVTDLGYASRRIVGISLSSIIAPTSSLPNGLASLKAQILELRNQYAAGPRCYLEQQNEKKGNAAFSLIAGVSATYTSESETFTIP